MAVEEPESSKPSAVQRAGDAAPSAAVKRRPRVSFGTKVFLGLILCAVIIYVERYPIMSAAAKWWIVDDPIVKSDAVVVLGGGLESRPSFAADLYRRGLVSTVLVSDVRLSAAADKGVLPPETDIAISLMEKEGVPASAIQAFGSHVNSTRDEAEGVRAWVEKHPVHRLIVPSDPFHTRRVKWLFTRTLRAQNVAVDVISIPTSRYDPLKWWTSEEALISFQNEVIKFAYYWLHY
jgi:uncharacterized SAM-binding protein YcdF (DUF218 family)